MCQIYLILLCFVICTLGQSRYPCGKLTIANGSLRYKVKAKIATARCSKGYQLVGDKHLGCVNGKWDNKPPYCVKPTCSNVNGLENGYVFYEYDGAVLRFYCKSGYKRLGSNITYCDGNRWSSSLPTCIADNSEPLRSCDFEKDFCGWSPDLNHEFDWKRQNHESRSGHIFTGPQYDHTLGVNKSGYYIFIESSSMEPNATARLISPIYEPMYTGMCFTFHYNMHGIDMGTLNVYVKKERDSSNIRYLKPLFTSNMNHGDVWMEGNVRLESVTQPFQIIIEGIRGPKSPTSDIAIDDLSLIDSCPQVTEDSDEYSTTEMNEDVSVPMIDTCENRCDNVSLSGTCDCIDGCIENNTCCPDYRIYCLIEGPDDYTETTTYEDETTSTELTTELTQNNRSTTVTTQIITSLRPVTTKPTQKVVSKPPEITIKIPTNVTQKITQSPPKVTQAPPTTTQKTTVIEKTIPQKTWPPQKVTQKPIKTIIYKYTKAPEIKPAQNITKLTQIVQKITQAPQKPKITTTTTQKPIKPDKKQTEVIKPTTTTTELPETTQAPPEIETDYLNTNIQNNITLNNKQMLQHNKIEKSNTKLIAGVVSLIVLVTLVVVTATIIFRKYGQKCIKGYSGSRRSDSFSDVRFLASDELLDFSMKNAED